MIKTSSVSSNATPLQTTMHTQILQIPISYDCAKVRAVVGIAMLKTVYYLGRTSIYEGKWDIEYPSSKLFKRIGNSALPEKEQKLVIRFSHWPLEKSLIHRRYSG